MSILHLTTLLWYRQAVDAQVIANTRNNQMRPFAINHGGEDKVRAEVPQFETSRDWSKRRTRNREIGVVDNQRTTNHRRKHNSPVGKGLVRKMREDNLCRHTSKHQTHGQAVQDEMIVFK